jgi:hypothetical protein
MFMQILLWSSFSEDDVISVRTEINGVADKEMTPDRGTPLGSILAGHKGSGYVRVQLANLNRFDLRHGNPPYRASPSPAMQKTGQRCCLIKVKDYSAVLVFNVHTSEKLLARGALASLMRKMSGRLRAVCEATPATTI